MKAYKLAYRIIPSLVGVISVISVANAETVISVVAAGEAFDGPPVFEISIGNSVIGHETLSKAIDTVSVGRIYQSADPDQYLERFEFKIPDAKFHADQPVSVSLVNDKFTAEGWGHDRNVFVRSIEVNGDVVRTGDLRMMNGNAQHKVTYQAGLLPVYHQNDKAVALPPEGGWPATTASARTSRLVAKPSAGVGTGG